MYKVTIYMADDNFDKYLGGQPTITYGLNEKTGVYEYKVHLNKRQKSSVGFHEKGL